MAAGIEIKGLDEVVKRLGRDLRPALKKAAFAIGEEIRGKVAVYPARRHGQKMAFVSNKQRRGFFAKLREGEIEVPYRRGQSPGSEQLGQRWATRAKGWGAVVGNPASYAPWVHSAEKQTAMHKETGWVTDEAAMEEVRRSGVVKEIVVEAVVKELRGG